MLLDDVVVRFLLNTIKVNTRKEDYLDYTFNEGYYQGKRAGKIELAKEMLTRRENED